MRGKNESLTRSPLSIIFFQSNFSKSSHGRLFSRTDPDWSVLNGDLPNTKETPLMTKRDEMKITSQPGV